MKIRRNEGRGVAGCYAAPLGGCQGKLNGEHVVSESVLRDVVSSGSNTVAVDGRPWQRKPRQSVGIGSLKAKILCEKHNGALSPFDTAMRDFGHAVTETIARVWLRSDPPQADSPVFQGDDLERWLLKVLIGTLVTEGAKYGVAGWKPPEPWLRTVFEGEAFPPKTGLYFATLGKQRITRSLYVLPVLSESRDGSSSGIILRFWIRGLEICLVPPDPSARIVLKGPSAISHRPDEVRFGANTRTASVRLAWSVRTPGPRRVWLTPLVPT